MFIVDRWHDRFRHRRNDKDEALIDWVHVEAPTMILAVGMLRGWRLALARAGGGTARLDRMR